VLRVSLIFLVVSLVIRAGLDIEPNPCVPGKCQHVNFVHGVQVTNTSFIDNFGGGIHVSLGKNLGSAAMPIGVRFDDCRINGTGYSGPLLAEGQRVANTRAQTAGAAPNAVVIGGVGAPFVNSGEVRFNNLSVANASGGVGLILTTIPQKGWAQLIMDHLTLTDVGFDERNPVYLSPINIFGSNPNGAPVAEPGDGGSPTGSIKILHALIRDRSARPYMRIVDPRGFRGVEFTGSVVNPYGCAVAAEAGFPLRNIFLARIPPSNLSVHTVCNKSGA